MMSFSKALSASLGVALWMNPASAADHLLPEASIFTGIYNEKTLSLISSRLGRMHDISTFANAVVFPSFDREFVISFEKIQSKYTLVCMQTKIPLEAYQSLDNLKDGTFKRNSEEETNDAIADLEARLPADYRDVDADVVELELARKLGQEIYDAWGELLYATRYPEPTTPIESGYPEFSPGEDGTTYHFSFFHKSVALSGWTWDSPADGRVAKLVAVTHAAKAACDSRNVSADSPFAQKVGELTNELGVAKAK